MNSKVLIGLLAVVVAAVAAFIIIGQNSQTRSATIGEILAENGFTEFKPPSQHVFPGTLVMVTATDPVALGVICRPLQSLGLDLNEIPASPSISTDLSAALDRTLRLDTQLLTRLKLNANLGDVQDIQLRLSNVQLRELSDDEVLVGLPDRSATCTEALELRLNSGANVTMIKSALVADVVYTATVQTDALGQADVDVRNELAASLNATVSGSDSGTIELSGEQLIWGIRDDRVLARLGTSQQATATEANDRRVLPAGTIVESLQVDDQAFFDSLGRPVHIALSSDTEAAKRK